MDVMVFRADEGSPWKKDHIQKFPKGYLYFGASQEFNIVVVYSSDGMHAVRYANVAGDDYHNPDEWWRAHAAATLLLEA